VTAEDEEEWPPRAGRYRAALWQGESSIERSEWWHAYRAFCDAAEAAPPAERELARGLAHLAAAGYKRRAGDARGAARQLAHARRRLAPFIARHAEVDVGALLTAVEAGD
jgi:hypothetical protein